MSEQIYILQAIDSLRNEVTTRDEATRELVKTRTDNLQNSLNTISAHLETLNSRTRKNETAVARLNLVVFGICGPAILAVLGGVISFFVK